MKPLPPRQKQIADFIRKHAEKEGAPPTFREIAAHFGVTISTIQEAIAALESKGVIKRNPGKARGLRLVVQVRHKPRTVPVVGRTTAGQPALALEQIEGHLVVDGSLFPEAKMFALRVEGDSMVEAGILDGDYAIVRRQSQVQNGEIALALVDNEEATIKRLYHRGKQVELRPANAAMSNLRYDARRVRVQGKVVGIYRKID